MYNISYIKIYVYIINNMSWNDYENETLIHNHKVSKIYKKRYQRASDFQDALYRLFGILTVLSSTISATLSWSLDLNNGTGPSHNMITHNSTFNMDEENNTDILLLRIIVVISALTASIQNFYKFQDNSNKYSITSRLYAKIQEKIECVGNIHPEYRTSRPCEFFKKIQEKMDDITENSLDLNRYMIKWYYSSKDDGVSYLEAKHEKYKGLQDLDKIKFSKIPDGQETVDSEEGKNDEIDVTIN